MTPADYPATLALWQSVPGMGLRAIDDSEAGIGRLLARNPGLSFVAEAEGRVVGCIMAGYDGRRAAIYHACVLPQMQNRGIATGLLEHILAALRAEGVTKAALVCYVDNPSGNRFWRAKGWTQRPDLVHYDYTLTLQD